MRATKKYIKRTSFLSIIILGLGILGFTFSEKANHKKFDEVLDIGSRLELMIDSFTIEEFKGNAKLKLQNLQLQNVAITHDSPWEEGTGTYHTVFRDKDIYRMYSPSYIYRIFTGYVFSCIFKISTRYVFTR